MGRKLPSIRYSYPPVPPDAEGIESDMVSPSVKLSSSMSGRLRAATTGGATGGSAGVCVCGPAPPPPALPHPTATRAASTVRTMAQAAVMPACHAERVVRFILIISLWALGPSSTVV